MVTAVLLRMANKGLANNGPIMIYMIFTVFLKVYK